MAAKHILCFLLFVGIVSVNAEDVLFPYGEKLASVDLNDIPENERNLYSLPYETMGSLLFDSMATSKTLKKKLGLNIPISGFRSAKTDRYFRAHPTFIKCAEQAIQKLLKNGITVEILKGFITSAESSGSDADKYHQSGSAMELGIVDSTGSVEDIASAVLQVCPAILERELRDLGLLITGNSVHFWMSEADSPGPSYSVEGYSGISDLEDWVQTEINRGLEPLALSECENYGELYSGDQYPSDRTETEIVGELDVKVTRQMIKDFKRLIQYQGSNIEFENAEGGASWCGTEDNPCPDACATRIKGNSASSRCADRLMTSRLLGVLNKVGVKARNVLGDKLKVLDAWDEPYEGHVGGDSGSESLHFEGRAANLGLVSGDITNLGLIGKYASCFGADYVVNRGTYIYVSVKKMKTGGSRAKFPNIDLLEMEPPEEVEHLYKLPDVFSESDASKYPLFDKSGKLDIELATGLKLGQFVSKDYRYFRMNPALVECLRDMIYGENQRKEENDPAIEIEVLRGYLTNRENSRKFDVVSDERYNKHNLGSALQIAYVRKSAVYSPYRLLYLVIDKCAHRFYEGLKMGMGVGLYQDSVFVDIRPRFTLMAESLNNLPDGVNRDTFENVIETRYNLAKKKRVVDPIDMETACMFQTAPKPQNSAFVHEHSEVVKRRRRRRSTTPDEGCIPTENTPFCALTQPHRQKVIDKLTAVLDRKHYSERRRPEILSAMKGCFFTCGTCLEGQIYEDKVENCNNFIHWVNWTLLNDQPDVSNFFVSMERHACEDGRDCVPNSPLFSLIAPHTHAIFRPDSKASVEELLYSPAGNPSAIMPLLEDMYAIQASGRATLWVKDDGEMTAMKRVLEVLMLYNKNVTSIDIHVEKYDLTKDAVTSVIEQAARTMATQGCPHVSRETLTPYFVLPVPTGMNKRSVEDQPLRYKLRREREDIDGKWLRQNMNF